MSTVIKVENLSKLYRLGDVGTGTISHDVNRWWHRIRGKEDPYLKIGETNDRASKGNSDYVWALKDINFEVKQGEVLGIIGRNGAGKSTLLKILSRTTAPTTGSVKIKGRVASLLEVGTGFHPELSGRDNIFLNGSIMGMTRREIQSKFDEIVDFAGVERYIDTPVKRYSSGMYVRLAFAVAAHLDPEILIVDEVLAVGDAEFQKKSLGKMKDVSEKQGRTVLFVSHQINAIQAVCNRALIISKGIIDFDGNPDMALGKYYHSTERIKNDIKIREKIFDEHNKKLVINKVSIVNQFGEETLSFLSTDDLRIKIDVEILVEGEGYNISFQLLDQLYNCIFTSKLFDHNYSELNSMIWYKGSYSYLIQIPKHTLKDGVYNIKAAAAIPLKEILDSYPKIVRFHYKDITSPLFKSGEGRDGVITQMLQWQIAKTK